MGFSLHVVNQFIINTDFSNVGDFVRQIEEL